DVRAARSAIRVRAALPPCARPLWPYKRQCRRGSVPSSSPSELELMSRLERLPSGAGSSSEAAGICPSRLAQLPVFLLPPLPLASYAVLPPATLQERHDGKHAAVVVVGFGKSQLAEDVVHVLLDRPLSDPDTPCDA